jgi:hypothetical protein
MRTPYPVKANVVAARSYLVLLPHFHSHSCWATSGPVHFGVR